MLRSSNHPVSSALNTIRFTIGTSMCGIRRRFSLKEDRYHGAHVIGSRGGASSPMETGGSEQSPVKTTAWRDSLRLVGGDGGSRGRSHAWLLPAENQNRTEDARRRYTPSLPRMRRCDFMG